MPRPLLLVRRAPIGGHILMGLTVTVRLNLVQGIILIFRLVPRRGRRPLKNGLIGRSGLLPRRSSWGQVTLPGGRVLLFGPFRGQLRFPFLTARRVRRLLPFFQRALWQRCRRPYCQFRFLLVIRVLVVRGIPVLFLVLFPHPRG